MGRIKKVISKVYNMIMKPEMKILPGQLAFFLVLSIIPTIALIGFVCSMFSVPLTGLINLINDVLPKGVGEILIPFINGDGLTLTVGVYMLLGFTLASNGPHSIIITSNTLYGIEHSNYLLRRIKAFFLTILLLSLFIFTLVVLAFGNNILNFVLNLKILSSASAGIYSIFKLLKWPVALLFIFIIVKLIYTISPDAKIPSKYTNKGSILTTVLWSFVTVFYSYYVTHFTHYDIFYGSLTNIILLMLWIYILSYILVLGMVINVNDYKMNNKCDN